MKILHSADLHLDTPFTGRSETQVRQLRRALLEVPGLLAALCRAEGCDLMLLSGDLFDGAYTKESFHALRGALEEAAVPVFISPGNHDFIGTNSPYLTEVWPKNVHIFTHPVMESVTVEDLDCKVYGAGYRGMDCDGLLQNFRAEGEEAYKIAVLHGDPVQTASPYCPITTEQVKKSGLHYLALGHIHKGGSFKAGKTLCAWPGCPMGRGYDEPEAKGALIVTLEDTVTARFFPLTTPRFYDLETPVSTDAVAALRALLPAVENNDFYRVTLTGPAPALDPQALVAAFAGFPNLEIRDRTLPETDIWSAAGEDSLEGIYFRLLQQATDSESEDTRQALLLAARISRQILDGQEVVLP